MEAKNYKDINWDYEKTYHPTIKGVQIINNKNNFNISWLNQMAYCEQQLKIQYLQGIETKRTAQMKQGSSEHKKLEDEFLKTAKTAPLEEIINISYKQKTISREMFVLSEKYGIRGFIDEIWVMPDKILIIDDKPGKKAYPSAINQIRAYCLALKDMTNEKRQIYGAIRERGTDKLIYKEEFTENEENHIKERINRLHGLFEGTKPFIPTKNPNKCKSCRFQSYCEYAQLQ